MVYVLCIHQNITTKASDTNSSDALKKMYLLVFTENNFLLASAYLQIIIFLNLIATIQALNL